MIRNPFVARGAIKSEKMFWNRTRETRTIYSLLLDSEENPQSIAVVGLRKIGKSSLLYRIADLRDVPSMYADQVERTVCVMLSMQAMSNASSPQFFAAILDELRDRKDPISDMLLRVSRSASTNPAETFTHLLRLMDKEEYLLVLLLDEFECASTSPALDKQFFDLLRSMAQKWRMAFVVATQTSLDELWDRSLISSPFSSPFFNFFQTLTLAGFREEEIDTYLAAMLREAGVAFDDEDFQIIKRAGGTHPFFVNVAAYHVFQRHVEQSDQPRPSSSTLWLQITRDPTIGGNLAYYWQILTPARKQALVEAAGGAPKKPATPERRVDLDWLERFGLLRKEGDEHYRPFSEAFCEAIWDLRGKATQVKSTDGGQPATVEDLIAENESAVLEFKSSLRWDYHQGKRTEIPELSAAKTISALLNSDGGTLIIGVDDARNVMGLEKDYCTLRKKDRDGFELFLMDLISEQIGKRFCQYVDAAFRVIGGLDVCQVSVEPSPEPVYNGKETDFYIRTGNSTRKLNTKEAVEYVRMHWPR